MQEEVFDMVILSVGLTIPKESKDLAESYRVWTSDKYGFVRTQTFNPP